MLNDGLRWIDCACALVGACLAYNWLSEKRKRRARGGLPLPPGPRGLPFVGNIFDIDPGRPWETYTEWTKQYGEIAYMKLFSQDVIVLNSERVVRSLIDQRSAIYSDRPEVPTNKLFGADFNTAFLPYDDEWKLHRKLFHNTLHAETCISYQPLILQRVHILLGDLLKNPGSASFEPHLRMFTASIILAVTYGYQAVAWSDDLVQCAAKLVKLLIDALPPHRAAVLGAFPILTRLPTWFPGAGFLRDAVKGRELARHALEDPFEYVKQQMAAGTASRSMVSDLLTEVDEKQLTPEMERAMKAMASTVFLAGFDTSSSFMFTFILAMRMHPDVQRRAQAEMDAVLGGGRLPTFEDRPSLPYIEAIIREVLRWQIILPLSLPHATSSDDVFEGYFIPKGAMVLPNVWAMVRCVPLPPNQPPADVFEPARHLDPSTGQLLPEQNAITGHPQFGFGRRVCPGRFLSEATMWAAIASILAVFDVCPALDGEGREVPVSGEYSTGISIRPLPFECEIRPRSKKAEQIILEALDV
ncbi:CyP450 monooxygenase [Coniophora puteana RWD-64-598 SS2]|uniref:CyP450 monooxygenase n=1 Tax=Coniophora puteana (strain RWD-64-598) TaxID=741705 RepID=A0A5M3MRA8_CONPW|nr:CyP450 monooxygenase [Coniophora puteana RWD-64-598 SS2]EIW81195.1 CyP450 monooxygenase [Coniophora puteana RWD-64-598 SS2]